MPRTFMHPRIIELARILMPMINNSPARPTKADRDALISVRNTIKNLRDGVIKLSDSDETDRQYLYTMSTCLANQQEDFYEKNGGKWEPMTAAQLIAMGGNAPLNDDLFKAFPIGNLSSFAAKELPSICRSLRVKTIGELEAKMRKECLDAQELKCNNKTLLWVQAVCSEVGI